MPPKTPVNSLSLVISQEITVLSVVLFYIPDTHCLCSVDFPLFPELCFLTDGASSPKFAPLHPEIVPMNSRAQYSDDTPFHKVLCEGEAVVEKLFLINVGGLRNLFASNCQQDTSQAQATQATEI